MYKETLQMKAINTLKSRIKTLKAILYTVMFFWLVILIYTTYDFITNEINPYLVLALILLVTSMTIIRQIKVVQEKKLAEMENEHN
ncbi:hypothetical protein [Mesohalobacter halotolerans]|uniref:Uncharacterized protein n=1 Tax=Mesohalobacter halotolerans TaxID=1883405 RepID=A0A4U5TRZ3_9FLAO|nr:hypothetical protein [Mesohalobacter halotolerans]MBS3737467.1 hypothetical protein [Psychroflexus sp.]TKS57047.1 hypothetical protein FCN74_01090 [Mesohalobacter halotolerans]